MNTNIEIFLSKGHIEVLTRQSVIVYQRHLNRGDDLSKVLDEAAEAARSYIRDQWRVMEGT